MKVPKRRSCFFKQLLFTKKHKGMEKRLKVKRKLYQGLLLALFTIVIAIVAAKMRTVNRDVLLFSEEYVPMREVFEELTFVPYEEEDWKKLFPGYEEKVLTQEDVRTLAELLGVAEYIDETELGETVTRAQWNTTYETIRKYLDTEELVQQENVMLLEVIAAEDGCVLITNIGDYTASFGADYLEEWQNYAIYISEEQCLGIVGKSQESVRLYNAFQKELTETELTFLYQGAEYTTEVNGLEASGGLVCDLEFQNGILIKKYEKQDTIEGELLSYDEKNIEISGYGKVKHEGKVPVYQTYADVQEKSLSDIVLGNMKVKYVVAGEEVCAILLVEPAQIQNIRVLLLADGKIGREDAYLKVAEDSTVSCGENVNQVPAGTVLHVTDYKLNETGATLCIEPMSDAGTVSLCNADGSEQGNPYYGSMEVRYTSDIGYTIVNEIPLEQYLYAVVPSEMPSSYGIEALKAQAVCARSYAYIQLLKADYASYGAHIDDSTAYQVYNISGRTEQSVQAVNETAGQVMTYHGNVIEAYYFSTSCGYTDTIAVWNQEDDGTYGYLQKTCLNAQDTPSDLSVEENFREYIESPNEGYDASTPFYRWSAKASFAGKEETLSTVLKTRKGIAPQNVIYYNKDGSTQIEEMDAFGKLLAVTVTERSASGSILNLRLQYENGAADVKTEYNIRRVLGAGAEAVTLSDGNEREMTILPSAYCAVIPLEDGSYKIYGGGYGHGLGMSQNGANGLAQQGKNYQEILEFFYRDITLSNMNEKVE